MNITFEEFGENMNKLWGRDSLRGMVVFEQRVLRSRKLTECIECGDPGTAQQESILIKSVPHYFMCDDCDAYWKAKA